MDKYRGLAGGGEMGALTRAKDWSKTPVGTPEHWPQSLLTTLGIILNSRFPMFLWWGPKLICFYNDAYRPSLGQNGKHPSILGLSAEEAWPEIWTIIKPLIDQVLDGGQATWSEDQLIPIFRNGKIEDVYWTFSYSPVYAESGEVGGVLVTCSETTEKISTLTRLEYSNQRYLDNIMQSPVAMCILRDKTHTVEIANSFMLEIWGKQAEEVLNKPIFEGLPEAKGQGLEALLDNVFNSGERFTAYERPVKLPRKGSLETIYINFTYEPLKEPDGTINGIVAIASDVTTQVVARKKIEESEERFRTMAEGTDVLIGVADETSNATYFNQAWSELTGRPVKHLLKYGWTDLVHPEDRQKQVDIYLSAFKKRIPFTNEFRVLSNTGSYRWLLAKGPPLFRPDGSFVGYISSCIDITERKNAEAERQKLATIMEASPEFIASAALDTTVEYVNPTGLSKLGWDNSNGRKLIDFIYPEDRVFATEVLEDLFKHGSFRHEIRFWNEKSGEPFWLEWNGISLKDSKTGEVTGLATVGPDITERKKAEKAFIESEQRVRSIVETAPFPIGVYVGDEMRIELANQAIIKTFGKGSNVIGKSYKKLLPELKGQQIFEQLDAVLKTGIPFHARNQRIDLVVNGRLQVYYFNYSFTPLLDTIGKVYGVINTAADITDLTLAKKGIEESEEKLNIVIRASELGIWELDLSTDEMTYSDRYLEIFGFDHDVVPARSHFSHQIHPDDMVIRNNAHKESLETSVLHYEVRLLWNDNSVHWIDVRGKVFYDIDARPLKMIGTVRDITAQKSYQNELEESEHKFRLLADSMPQYIWTADPAGNMNYFNSSVFNYSGLTPEQISQDGWLQIVHPDDREENIKTWFNAVTSGNDFLFEHRFRRYDGGYRWQLSRAVPYKDSAGNIQMWVGTSTDIQEIKELDQQKDFFISMASHELKTPITSIKGYIQILQSMYEDQQDTFLINSLKIVDRQVKTLNDLISDLLDLSKIKSGNLFLQKEPFDINQLIQDVIDEIKHVNPRYIINYSSEYETQVNADRKRINQVLINFLTNAVKYSPNATEIKVQSTVNDNNVLVAVEDQGIGINKNDQEKIFERFYRVEGKNEKKFPGFGIGLFISADIINRHNGKIGVKSKPGEGSTFYFSLPLDQ